MKHQIMTVQNMIDRLSKMNPDALVIITRDGPGHQFLLSSKHVRRIADPYLGNCRHRNSDQLSSGVKFVQIGVVP